MTTDRASAAADGWDWRAHSTGPALPCRICRRPSILRDENERPCHKVCAEAQLAPTTIDRKGPILMQDNGLLAAALSAAIRGWHVFPVRPGDKRPAIDRWEQRATTDPDRIRRCWTAGPYNVGIACGPSSLVVLDFDARKTGQAAPAGAEGYMHGWGVFTDLCADLGHPVPDDTYAVTTGRGGLHLYFRHPNGAQLRNTQGDRGGLGWLIDTRAHGGYVVAAGSTVAGRSYTVRQDAPTAVLPGWLTDRLRPAPLRPEGPPVVIELPADRRGAYVRAAIDGTLTKLAEAGEGGRNHALFMAAQTLGQLVAGGAVAEDTVTTVLTDAGTRLGLRPQETERTIASGLRAGARRPRQVA